MIILAVTTVLITFMLIGPSGLVRLFTLRDLNTDTKAARGDAADSMLTVEILRDLVTDRTPTRTDFAPYSGTPSCLTDGTPVTVLPVGAEYELTLAGAGGDDEILHIRLTEHVTGDSLDLSGGVPGQVYDAFIRAHE